MPRLSYTTSGWGEKCAPKPVCNVSGQTHANNCQETLSGRGQVVEAASRFGCTGMIGTALPQRIRLTIFGLVVKVLGWGTALLEPVHAIAHAARTAAPHQPRDVSNLNDVIPHGDGVSGLFAEEVLVAQLEGLADGGDDVVCHVAAVKHVHVTLVARILGNISNHVVLRGVPARGK